MCHRWTADRRLDGNTYWATCTRIKTDELPDPLPPIYTWKYKDVEARGPVETSPQDAIALLIPEDFCGTDQPAWLLFLNRDLPTERADQVTGRFD